MIDDSEEDSADVSGAVGAKVDVSQREGMEEEEEEEEEEDQDVLGINNHIPMLSFTFTIKSCRTSKWKQFSVLNGKEKGHSAQIHCRVGERNNLCNKKTRKKSAEDDA